MSWQPPEEYFDDVEKPGWKPPEELFDDSPTKIKDVSTLQQMKASGQQLTRDQERILWDADEAKPLTTKASEAITTFFPTALDIAGQLGSGAAEFVYKGILKPIDAMSQSPEEAEKTLKEAKNTWRSAVHGVAQDVQETADAGVRFAMFGSSITDKLLGRSNEDRFERYMLREGMREFSQRVYEDNPDAAARLIAENPMFQQFAYAAALAQGGTEEEAQMAKKAYEQLVKESGLTKDEINENVALLGEVISPLSLPGTNTATKFLNKGTSKVVQKTGELALRGIKPLAKGVEKTAGGLEKLVEGTEKLSRKIGEYTVGDPDTLLKAGTTTVLSPVKIPAKMTRGIARTVADVAGEAGGVGGAAGRRGMFERAGRSATAGDLTKRLFGPESLGGKGRARAADWAVRQANAIAQPAVNGAVLNIAMGLPDIETGTDLGYMAGVGAGIGGYGGARLPERAYGLIDPTTSLAQKIDSVLTPDPAGLRRDQDADIQRFVATADPTLLESINNLSNLENIKGSIDLKIKNLEGKRDAQIRDEDAKRIQTQIDNLQNQRKQLDKSTPQTEAEIKRQIQLSFADAMDLAKTTGAAAGLNNIQVKVLNPDNVEQFYRDLYGKTLTDAESVVQQLVGNPRLTEQESAMLKMADETIKQFFRDVAGATTARGFAISESSARPEHLRYANQKGSTVVINGDLVAQMGRDGLNLGRVINHEMQHALSNFQEVQDMLAPLRRQLFDQKIQNPDGTFEVVSNGAISDAQLDQYALQYAAAMDANGGQSFLSQFANMDQVRAYMKEEVLSELAGLSGASHGDLRSSLDSTGRQVVDWLEVKSKNGALKKIKEGLRRFGVLVDDQGQFSSVLGAQLTPEALAAMRQYQRKLRDLNESMVYNSDPRKDAPEVTFTQIATNRVLQRRYKHSDFFAQEQVVTLTTPDGNTQEIVVPPGAKVDSFVADYRFQGGQLVDADGNPVSLGPDIPLQAMPDGTAVTIDTRVARNADGSPQILSPRETKRRAKKRGEAIRKAIDDAPDDGSGLRLEDTGNGNYRGTLSPAQIAAINALPNDLVAPSLKRKIAFFNDILGRKDGSIVEIEYQAALRDGKYRALQPQLRTEIPIGFQFDKQGNFLMTTMSMSRMYDKANAWAAKRPRNLRLWGVDMTKFWDSVRQYLTNHKAGLQGHIGLHPDPETAMQMKNRINDLFNVYRKETREANPERTTLPKRRGQDSRDVVIRSRRMDRINSYDETALPKMPFQYELAVQNYLPAENPFAEYQSPEQFAQAMEVEPEMVQRAIRGDIEPLELQLHDQDLLRPAEYLDVRDGQIRVRSMFDPTQNVFVPGESEAEVPATAETQAPQVEASSIPVKFSNASVSGPGIQFLPAFHRGKQKVEDRFQLKYVGQGTGRQVHGWGLYFGTDERVVDKQYPFQFKYKVDLDLAPDEAIDWDAPIDSRLQADAEQLLADLEADMVVPMPQMDTNGDFYEALAEQLMDPKEASMRLLERGIPAIRYLDERSRFRTAPQDWKYNYVVFDEAKIKILDETDTLVGPVTQFMPTEAIGGPSGERGFQSKLQLEIQKKFKGARATPEQLKAMFGEYIATIVEKQDDGKDKTVVVGRFPVDLKSQAEAAIRNKKGGKIDWQSSNQIKEDEIKWSGVLDEIDRLAQDNKGKVPVQELLNYLRDEGQVKFEEVTLGGGKTKYKVSDYNNTEYYDTYEEAEAAKQEWIDNALDYYDLPYAYQAAIDWTVDEVYDEENNVVGYTIYDDYNDAFGKKFDTKEEAENYLNEWKEKWYLDASPSEKSSIFDHPFRKGFDSEEDAIDSAKNSARESIEGDITIEEEDTSETKFSNWVLPGGENYREVVLTTAQRKGQPKVVPHPDKNLGGFALQYSDGSYAGGDSPYQWRTKLAATEGVQKYKDEYGDIGFTSSHFPDVPNYIAHMRLNERTTKGIGYAVRNTQSGRKGPVKPTRAEAEADLKQYPASYSLEIVEVPRDEPGLFVEEFQSDRHQKGRKEGYSDEIGILKPQFKIKKITENDSLINLSSYAKIGDYALFEDNVPVWLLDESKSEQDAVKEFEKIVIENNQANDYFEKRSGIPDAPFRKDWGVQLFKRALRDAVESGKLWIGWTTGIEQVKRYENAMRQTVDEIEWTTPSQKPKSFGAIKNGRTVLSGKINDDGTVYDSSIPDANGMQLSEVVGKNVAAKILAENSGTAAGDDLTIGGEGMKGFYDQILPKEIGKYVAKMGGKVEKSEIGQEITKDDLGMEGLEDATPEELAEFEATGKVVGETVPIWRVNITPEMENVVRAGQIQFMPADGDYPSVGININSKTQDFTDQILRGEKTIETRPSNSLKSLIGKRVGIVRTGKGKATLVGYANIQEPIVYNNVEEFRADQDKHLVEAGSDFDIKPDQKKYGYPLTDVESIEPIEVPSNLPNWYSARSIPQTQFMPAEQESPTGMQGVEPPKLYPRTAEMIPPLQGVEPPVAPAPVLPAEPETPAAPALPKKVEKTMKADAGDFSVVIGGKPGKYGFEYTTVAELQPELVLSEQRKKDILEALVPRNEEFNKKRNALMEIGNLWWENNDLLNKQKKSDEDRDRMKEVNEFLQEFMAKDDKEFTIDDAIQVAQVDRLTKKINELKRAMTPAPFKFPADRKTDLKSLQGSVATIFKTKKFKQFIADATGVQGIQFDNIFGTWKFDPEPSFVFSAPGMTWEQSKTVTKWLSFLMTQDAGIAWKPSIGLTEGAPSVYLVHDKKLTEDQILKAFEKAKEVGIDGLSVTVDGKGLKAANFDGIEGFGSKLVEIQKSAGIKNSHETLVDSFYYDTTSDFTAEDGSTRVPDWLKGTSINEKNLQDQQGEVAGGMRETGDNAITGGLSVLLRGGIDSVLVPYAKFLAGEGFTFDPDRFAERYGLGQEVADYIREQLYPTTGLSRSVTPILEGTEKFVVPESFYTNDGKLKTSVNDLLYALQRRSADDGFISPGDYSPRAGQIISETIVDEVLGHMERAKQNPDAPNAIGWYDAALKRMKAEYAKYFPFLNRNSKDYNADKEFVFDSVLGITSQGNNVFENGKMAARIQFLLENGKTLPEIASEEFLYDTFGGQTRAIENNLLKLDELLKNNDTKALDKIFRKKMTVSEWNAYLKENKNLYFKGEPLSVDGKADQMVTGFSVFGPKIGSFINNLHGDYSTLTADLWFTRTWNRILGNVFQHASLKEAKQYDAFRKALIEQYRKNNSETYRRKFDPLVKKINKEGKKVLFDYLNETELEGLSENEFGDLINDPQRMLDFATALEDRFRSGQYKTKSDLRRAAKNWIENRSDPVAAPRTDLERDFQQNVMEIAQKKLRRKGIDISIADMQAALWYNEKELFGIYGAQVSGAEPADYADSAENVSELLSYGTLFQLERLVDQEDGTKKKEIIRLVPYDTELALTKVKKAKTPEEYARLVAARKKEKDDAKKAEKQLEKAELKVEEKKSALAQVDPTDQKAKQKAEAALAKAQKILADLKPPVPIPVAPLTGIESPVE